MAVTIAYTFGWRMQSEVLALQLRQVDFDAGTIRLDPGATKNDAGRIAYLTPELKSFLAAQVERVSELMRRRSTLVPYIFPHLHGRFKGKPILDFRRTWTTACEKAHLPKMLRHDFRRTAVMGLVNSGVPERVAMMVTGHQTRSVFDRYHIVNPFDLQEASRKLAFTIQAHSAQSQLDANPAPVYSANDFRCLPIVPVAQPG